MAQLLFNIKNQWIYRTDKFKPVAKSRNYLYAQFTFLTCEWEGMTATALFENDKQVIEQLIDQDGVCEVPWEMLDLDSKGEFYVSVFAGDLITANRVRVTVYESGYTDDAESSRPPTPSIYAQIIERMDGIEDEMEEATREAKAAAESALESKEAAETSAGNAASSAGAAYNSAEAASASALAASQSANSANNAKNDAIEAKNDAVSAKNDAVASKTAAENAQAEAEAALREIRALISSLTDIPIVMTDAEGNEVNVMALGRIEE